MKSFTSKYDFLFLTQKEAVEGKGEDSFYCCGPDEKRSCAVAGVFDGSGGIGSRTHESFQGHTEAYIASRSMSGALCDWYRGQGGAGWDDPGEMADSINSYFLRAYRSCTKRTQENVKIMGSMVRSFPTTAAILYAQDDREGVLIHALWAGDSRVYLIDEDGLAQLSEDDVDQRDAFDNLYEDGAMTNLLSSDGEYEIHHKSFRIARPTVVFAATDGCFGYFPTPMEFEYAVTASAALSDSPEEWRRSLGAWFGEYAGDDFALCLMSFYHKHYPNLRKALSKRTRMLSRDYIEPLGECRETRRQETDAYTRELWEKYRTGYERFLEKSKI